MSELEQIKKLMKINGDDQKYAEGLQILNSGNSDDGGRLLSFLIGVLLIGGALALSPNMRAALVQGFNQFVQEGSSSVEPVRPVYPPQPPSLPGGGIEMAYPWCGYGYIYNPKTKERFEVTNTELGEIEGYELDREGEHKRDRWGSIISFSVPISRLQEEGWQWETSNNHQSDYPNEEYD